MNVIELLKVIILGIVEGITEWLPISSTGHMILVDEFIHLNVTDEFKELFLVVIQLGAIMAVVVMFWKKIFPFDWKAKPVVKKETFQLWFKILVACIPAGVIGILLNEKIDELFYNYVVVAVMLILYGIIFIWMENRNAKVKEKPKINELSQITYKTALWIGFFQLLSLIPGTSRSGATIIGAMLVGASRYVAAEFTFFLAIPVMFGASLVKLLKFGFSFTGAEMMILLTGMAVAFLVSILAIKFLMEYIKKHDFKAFGWYRIVLGILVLGYFMIKTMLFV